jgi:metallophosphoesterase (TIGR00282 family)
MKNILFIGDIVGEGGMYLVLDLLPRIMRDFEIDFVIANGENLNKGKGLSVKQANQLHEGGVSAITTGNHIWSNKADNSAYQKLPFVLRPYNYPQENPGNGYFTTKMADGTLITVINLQGRSFMFPIDCPFAAADDLIGRLKENPQISIIDLHAESTAEKQAFARYVDGGVSAVLGTHTHVQTADECVFQKGTGYITDVGMTGPFESVIGMEIDTAVKRFRYQTPFYYKLAEGDLRFNGVLITVNENTYKTISIERLNFSKTEYNGR